jgi:fructose-1-phosphate kinase PfkB-like protein
LSRNLAYARTCWILERTDGAPAESCDCEATTLRKSISELHILCIGSPALDILSKRLAGPVKRQWVEMGGVGANVARALGAMGCRVTFMTPRFSSEDSDCLELHLRDYDIERVCVGAETILPRFEAELGANGSVISESFLGDSAFDSLSPKAIRGIINKRFSLVISTTDLNSEAIIEIQNRCDLVSTPFWLINSSAEKVCKLTEVGHAGAVVGLNILELRDWLSAPVDSINEIRAGMKSLSAGRECIIVSAGDTAAYAFVTLTGQFIKQSVDRCKSDSTVGAGDVLFSAAAIAHSVGYSWDASIRVAVSAASAFACQEKTKHRFAILGKWDLYQPPRTS